MNSFNPCDNVITLPYTIPNPWFDEVVRLDGLTRFLKFVPMAEEVAKLSKDPSTKVGALALDDDLNIRATGYNGFPRGVFDDPRLYADRPSKYARTVHAEQNLVCQAARTGVSLQGCTVLLTALYPCNSCAGVLIQSGIRRILAPDVVMPERWAEQWEISREMLSQAGVEVLAYADQNLRKVV